MKKPNAAIRDANAALEVDLASRFACLNLVLFFMRQFLKIQLFFNKVAQ